MSGAVLDEVDAMRKVAEALEGLPPPELKRVLRWANDKYGHSPQTFDGGGKREVARSVAGESEAPVSPQDLGELFTAVAPQTEPDRALVVAYWMQEVRGDQDVDAQAVNKELKHLGEGVSNITKAFGRLIDQKPQLVIQTRKEGTTQQARKKYRVTAAGKREVLKRLSANPDSQG